MKLFLFGLLCLFQASEAFGQLIVENATGGPLSQGSWIKFISGGNDDTSIQENWGLNLNGSTTHPVKVSNSSLLVGYSSTLNNNFGVGNVLVNGRLGIGTLSPQYKLHIKGSDLSDATLFLQPAQFSGTGARAQIILGDDNHSIQTGWGEGTTFSDVDKFLFIGGNVGIGTSTPDSKLSVNGNIRAKEIKVETANWPDYVFDPEYNLFSLSNLKSYLQLNRHLPGIPSAAETSLNGVNLGEMNKKLLEKVEELTLHLIQQDEVNVEQNKKMERLSAEISQLKNKLNKK